MKGYVVCIDLGETTGYLKNKEQGDKQEFITPYFSLSGHWTAAAASKVADRWIKKGYRASVAPDLSGSKVF